jgi:hypothetical protein
MSASAATITGATPPCSSAQRAPGASCERSVQPTLALPIKLRKATQPGLAQHLDEAQTGQRRGLGRLDDHRAAGGDGRPDLMRDQIERVVEGGDGDHHADRLRRGESEAVGAGSAEVHRDDLTLLRAQLLHRDAHRVDGARHLHPGVEQRLAAFARRFQRQGFGAGAHQAGGSLEDFDASGQRQPGVAVAVQLVRDGQRMPDGGGVGRRHGGDGLAVERREHRDIRCGAGRIRHHQGIPFRDHCGSSHVNIGGL